MKVQPAAIHTTAPLTYGRVGRPAAAATAQQAGAAATLSPSSFVSELGAAARAHPHGEVRADVVAQAKADIASGRLGSPEDLERTIDRFLMELG